MTSKTGNVKKYHVFCRMLSNALVRSSDAVFIDLLTMADLETLRARRQQAATAVSAALQHQSSSSDPLSASASGALLAAGVGLTADAPLPTSASSVAKSNKRFLILTYLVEFDRCACVALLRATLLGKKYRFGSLRLACSNRSLVLCAVSNSYFFRFLCYLLQCSLPAAASIRGAESRHDAAHHQAFARADRQNERDLVVVFVVFTEWRKRRARRRYCRVSHMRIFKLDAIAAFCCGGSRCRGGKCYA
jgi:hypothetical protein